MTPNLCPECQSDTTRVLRTIGTMRERYCEACELHWHTQESSIGEPWRTRPRKKPDDFDTGIKASFAADGETCLNGTEPQRHGEPDR